MICPKCKSPMALARNEGGVKSFVCEYCKRRITRREAEKTGYSGQMVVGGWVPGARGQR